jgi:hypothetical protein
LLQSASSYRPNMSQRRIMGREDYDIINEISIEKNQSRDIAPTARKSPSFLFALESCMICATER